MAASGGCLNDNRFGPAVGGCRGNFDFTITFEHIFFSIIPAAVFVVFAAWRTLSLTRTRSVVDGTAMQIAKQIPIVAWSALKLAILVLTTTSTAVAAKRLSVAAASLEFISTIPVALLSWMEHSRSPRPSPLLIPYLLLTLLLGTSKSRTLLLSPTSRTIGRLYTASIANQALIIITESIHKRRWLKQDLKSCSAEEISGPVSLSLFAWLNSLFLQGGARILKAEELPRIPASLSVAHHDDNTKRRGLFSEKKSTSASRLARRMLKALWWSFFKPIPPRIAMIGFTICQPFLIWGLQKYLLNPNADENVGYGWIGATILIYTGIAISTALHQYYAQQTAVAVRGYITTALFDKMLTLPSTASEKSASLTLMSADLERIQRVTTVLHEYWATLVQVALSAWLLYLRLGLAFLVPLGVVAACFAFSIGLSKISQKHVMAWQQAIQVRISATANLINSLKLVHMLGLAGEAGSTVADLRTKELKASKRFRNLIAFSVTNSMSPTLIMPLLTFAATSRTLDVSTVFVSLSFMILFAMPLVLLLQILIQTRSAWVCLGRIGDFLELDERKDYRRIEARPGVDSEKSDLVPDEKKSAEVGAVELKEPSSKGVSEPQSPENEDYALRLEQASYGWEDGKNVLQDLNLELPSRSLTIVVGPVGSGKTSLCTALLGEIPFAQGSTRLSESLAGRVAYCSQTPFLPNIALRAAIVSFFQFDESWYQTVLRVAALRPDLEQLSDGDQTLLGSNGATLSGGQKLRVALARALYARPKFLILDDIFSGLDQRTGSEIFHGLFAAEDGLVKTLGATTVLCTHDTRHLRLADKIVVLSVDGSIEKQGRPDVVLQHDDVLSKLKTQEFPDMEAYKPAPAKVPVAIPDEDERHRQIGDVAVYRHYFGMFGKTSWVLTAFLCLTNGFLYNFVNVWLKFFTDERPGPDAHSRGYWLGIYGMLEVVCLIAVTCLVQHQFAEVSIKVAHILHKRALKTLMAATLGFITNTDTGKTLNRFSQDLNVVDTELTQALVNLMTDSFTQFGQAIVIVLASPWLALSYPPILGVLYLLQKFYLRTSRQLRFLDLEMKSPLYTQFLDAAAGLTTIRSFGWSRKFLDQSQDLLNASQRPVYLLAMIQQWLTTVLNLTVAVIATVLVTLATQLRESAGFTSLSLIALMTFGAALTRIVMHWTNLETSIGAISRLKRFSEDAKSEEYGEDLDDVVEVPADWPSLGKIELKDVSAAYNRDPNGSGASEKDESDKGLALKGVSLSIAPGEKVVLCGRTGSGKSSMVNVLLRLLRPLPLDDLVMEIDGISILQVPRATLRSRLICIPQDPFFMPSGSIRENLDPYHSATDEECSEALALVGLDKIWPSLDEDMKRDSLSQGQKQLFSVGRAVLRRKTRHVSPTDSASSQEKTNSESRCGVLLLDEFTANVDRQTEKLMLEIVKSEFVGWTVVAIAHRLEGLEDFDRFIVMEDGRIIKEVESAEMVN